MRRTRALGLSSVLVVSGLALAEEPRPKLALACTADRDCASTLRDDAC
jgi:hypothetical protein